MPVRFVQQGIDGVFGSFHRVKLWEDARELHWINGSGDLHFAEKPAAHAFDEAALRQAIEKFRQVLLFDRRPPNNVGSGKLPTMKP